MFMWSSGSLRLRLAWRKILGGGRGASRISVNGRHSRPPLQERSKEKGRKHKDPLSDCDSTAWWPTSELAGLLLWNLD